MINTHEDQLTVLGICVDSPLMIESASDMNYMTVQSGRRAIEMLRMTQFEFILVGTQLSDMSTWDFLRHVKTMWPQQKWALVGAGITPQQEITARMFGSTMIFDATPTANELLNVTSRIHVRSTGNSMAGRFDRSERSNLRPVRAAV
jgi:hypothetical protein